MIDITIAFICDRCNKQMEYESDRYWIKSHIDNEQLDLCPRCTDIVKAFITDQETEDQYDDDSVKTRRRR